MEAESREKIANMEAKTEAESRERIATMQSREEYLVILLAAGYATPALPGMPAHFQLLGPGGTPILALEPESRD